MSLYQGHRFTKKNKDMKKEIKLDYLTPIDNDANGNQRIVAHFLLFITDKEDNDMSALPLGGVQAKHALALARARALGGKAYRAKWYGGGIVFAENPYSVVDKINNLIRTLEAQESNPVAKAMDALNRKLVSSKPTQRNTFKSN